MNEEEKKAVEELKEFIKGPCETCRFCAVAYKLNRKNVIHLLNLIGKTQTENEQLRTEMNSLQKENKELNKKLILQKGVRDYWCEAYMELQKERERKK